MDADSFRMLFISSISFGLSAGFATYIVIYCIWCVVGVFSSIANKN